MPNKKLSFYKTLILRKIKGQDNHTSSSVSGLKNMNYDKVAEKIINDLENMERIKGYSWGIEKLDFVTGGIQTGRTYIIGALKKAGKSRFVINTIYNLHKKDVASQFFSLEMTETEVLQCLASRFGKFSTDVFERKEDVEPVVFNKAVEMIKEKNIAHVCTQPGLNYNQIEEHIIEMKKQDVKVVFIDFLQRMAHDQHYETEALALQKITAKLADCAKLQDVAIIILAQLNMGAEGRKANIADLKGSSGIAENADCILILNNIDRIKKEHDHKKKTGKVTISIDQRSGDSDDVDVKTSLEICEFYDPETIKEDLSSEEQEIMKKLLFASQEQCKSKN